MLLASAAAMLLVAAPARGVAPRGDLDVLVVLAQFPDRALASPRARFTGGPDALVDRFVGYWTEVSSGRLRLHVHVAAPVVTLPRPRARYVQQPRDLAADALTALAAQADDPGDRAALAAGGAAVVFFAGIGKESHTRGGDPTDPWSNYTGISPPVQGFADAIVVAEREEAPARDGTLTPLSPFGVMCHEFGHLLGLPELYAPSGMLHEGIGIWGLMGQGTWLGRGDHPPHLSAWSKMRLGWVDVERVEETRRGVTLAPVEREPRVLRVAVAPNHPHEYYLLEYRARIGADARLPGEGLLVWHVDERRMSFRRAQADPEHKLLHLVEADGRGDLDRGTQRGGNRGDASDPWVGPSRWRRLLPALVVVLGGVALAGGLLRLARAPRAGPVAAWLVLAGALVAGGLRLRPAPVVCGPWTPGMAPYDGVPGQLVIGNLSPAGAVMRFDLHVGPVVPSRLVPQPDHG